MDSFSVSQSTPGPASSNRTPRVLACVLCQSRKIKCDRNFPCANCTKANTECIQSTPAPPRKRKRHEPGILDRLGDLERRMVQVIGGVSQESSSANGQGPRDQTAQWYQHLEHPGKLVDENDGIRFVDSRTLGTIYEELREMRRILEREESDAHALNIMVPDDNPGLLLGAGCRCSADFGNAWPDASEVPRLWEIFLQRVNPLIKIVHVPTLKQYVAIAASNRSGLPKSIEALLFSIWLMAVVALSPQECLCHLGRPRDVALQRFSDGVRTALAQLNFLRSCDFSSLQALVMYLISLQGRYNRHAAWALNGVVLRIAQKMGLHRDGEKLGLSPFDAEMRRRLWWQIIMLDIKYAMLTGLNHGSLPAGWDTKEPKNLDDADMCPTATKPFQDRKGPTEMIFVLIANKVARFLISMPHFEMMAMAAVPSSTRPNDPKVVKFREAITRLGHELLDALNKFSHPAAGPVHEMAVEVKAQLIRKLEVLATSADEQPEWATETMDQTDRVFKLAVCALEHEQEHCLVSEHKGFLWFALLNFNLDVFLFVAGQLCDRLEGSIVDRAWKQVESVYRFHPELYETSTNKTYYTLARFILQAWAKREDLTYSKRGQIPETPCCVANLRGLCGFDIPRTGPVLPAPAAANFLGTPENNGLVAAFDHDGFASLLDPSEYDINGFPG